MDYLVLDGIYLEGDDYCIVSVWNRFGAAQTLSVSLALMLPGERRLTNMEDVFTVPAAGGSVVVVSREIPLTSATLMGWRVHTTGVVQRGQTFVRLQIRKGGSQGFSRRMIAANYVTNATPITNGSPIISPTEGRGYLFSTIQGAPGAGFSQTITVPSLVRVRIGNVIVPFTTDATAILRRTYFTALTGAGLNLFTTYSDFEQPASRTVTYYFGGYADTELFTPFRSRLPIPRDLEIIGGGSIQIFADNAQAGDQLQDTEITWEEWIDV
jgi:hypothetical protein